MGGLGVPLAGCQGIPYSGSGHRPIALWSLELVLNLGPEGVSVHMNTHLRTHPYI